MSQVTLKTIEQEQMLSPHPQWAYLPAGRPAASGRYRRRPCLSCPCTSCPPRSCIQLQTPSAGRNQLPYKPGCLWCLLSVTRESGTLTNNVCKWLHSGTLRKLISRFIRGKRSQPFRSLAAPTVAPLPLTQRTELAYFPGPILPPECGCYPLLLLSAAPSSGM